MAANVSSRTTSTLAKAPAMVVRARGEHSCTQKVDEERHGMVQGQGGKSSFGLGHAEY